MSDEERSELVDFLARNPLRGDLVEGTGGLRKLRWARRGSGKSGGYRTVYFYCDDHVPIYAILVYGKGQQADLSQAQRKAAAGFVSELKRTLRAGRG